MCCKLLNHSSNLNDVYIKIEAYTHTHTHTWWFTLTDIVDLPQPGVSVAGQIVSDHLTFSQQGDEDGDWDGDDQDAHQELPVAWWRFRVHRGGCDSSKVYFAVSYFVLHCNP